MTTRCAKILPFGLLFFTFVNNFWGFIYYLAKFWAISSDLLSYFPISYSLIWQNLKKNIGKSGHTVTEMMVWDFKRKLQRRHFSRKHGGGALNNFPRIFKRLTMIRLLIKIVPTSMMFRRR